MIMVRRLRVATSSCSCCWEVAHLKVVLVDLLRLCCQLGREARSHGSELRVHVLLLLLLLILRRLVHEMRVAIRRTVIAQLLLLLLLLHMLSFLLDGRVELGRTRRRTIAAYSL